VADYLTAAQVYSVAVQAGFRGNDAIIATAITKPESGANAAAIQAGQPYATTGWGLWQITPGDSVPSVGVNEALLNPLTNARAAYVKYAGSRYTFHPWTTYRDGAYQAWLGWAQAGAAGGGGGGGIVLTGAPGGGGFQAGQAWQNALIVWQNVEFEYTTRYDQIFNADQAAINTAYTLR